MEDNTHKGNVKVLSVNVYEFSFCWSFRVKTDRMRFTICLQKKKTLIDLIGPP